MTFGKRFFLLCSLIALVACDLLSPKDPHVVYCEQLIEQLAKSPSTVEIVEISVFEQDDKDIFIEFDAQNSFGAIIRTIANCKFPADNGSYAEEIASMTLDGIEVDQMSLSLAKVNLARKRLKDVMNN